MSDVKLKIGIVGMGFVGGAVAQGFVNCSDLKMYDKYKAGFDYFENVCMQDFIFVAVPTGTRINGEQDISVVEDIIEKIDAVLRGIAHFPVVILKSTCLPGTTRGMSEEFPRLRIVYNPEFLTARFARLDFINPARIVIGGEKEDVLAVSGMYRTRFPHSLIFTCTWEEAELVKYMSNCFFALKIAYVNEMYDVCRGLGVSYDLVRDMWLADGRIGNSHHEVPGHDGDRGFGGACFPKDSLAFKRWCEDNGYGADTVGASLDVNDRVRKLKDWKYEK